MHCLVGAVVDEGVEAHAALTATALARDLADTHRDQAATLLRAAAHEAAAYLDAADLATDAFAAALRRLTSIRARVDALLIDYSARLGHLPA